MNSSVKMQILLVKIYLTGKSSFFFAEIVDKTNQNKGNESDKENEEQKEEVEEETEEEIPLAKALEMVDKMTTYGLRKGIADPHSQV